MTRSRAAVEAALKKKGFTLREGDHHYFCLLDEQGRPTRIITKTSHSPKHKDLGDPLLGEMAKQLHLTKREFVELIDCALSEGQYRARLKEKGLP